MGTNLGRKIQEEMKKAGVSVPKERPIPPVENNTSPANETTSASSTAEVPESTAVKTPEEMKAVQETFQNARFSIGESLDRMRKTTKKNQTYAIKKMKGQAMEESVVSLADVWRAKKDSADEIERYLRWKENPHEAELPPSELDSVIANLRKKVADADKEVEKFKNELEEKIRSASDEERKNLFTFDELEEATLHRMMLRSDAWKVVDILVSDSRPSDIPTLRTHTENAIASLSAPDMKILVSCDSKQPGAAFWKDKNGEKYFMFNPHFIQDDTKDETLEAIARAVSSTAEYVLSAEKAEADKREQSARNSGFYSPNALTEVRGKGNAYAVAMLGNKIPHYRREKCTIAIPAYGMPGNLIADIVPTKDRDTVVMFVRCADTVELAEWAFKENGVWRGKGIPLKSTGGVLDVRNAFLKNSITAFMNAVDESSSKHKARKDFVYNSPNGITENELKGGVPGELPFMINGWKHSKTGEKHDPSGILFSDGKTVTLQLCFREDYDEWGLYHMPEPGIAFPVSDFSTDPKSRLWHAFFSLNRGFLMRVFAKKLSDTYHASSIVDVLKRSNGTFVAFGKTRAGTVGYAITVATVDGRTTHTIVDAFNDNRSKRLAPEALGGMQFAKERSVGMLSEAYKRFLRESYMKIAKCSEHQVHGSIKQNVPTHTESTPVTETPTEVMEPVSETAEEIVAPETETMPIQEPVSPTPHQEEMSSVAEPVLLSAFPDFSKGELGNLAEGGITTLAELKAAPHDRLASLKGIGPKTLEKIKAFLSKQ